VDAEAQDPRDGLVVALEAGEHISPHLLLVLDEEPPGSGDVIDLTYHEERPSERAEDIVFEFGYPR
jgi:hypothetical protein